MTPEMAQVLTELADYLEHEVPEEKLDMTIWARGRFTPEKPCGTKACAMGHATQLFPERFKLMHRNEEQYYADLYTWNPTIEDWQLVTFPVSLADYFGITKEETKAVFGIYDAGYGVKPTPKHVADNIRALVEKYCTQALGAAAV